MCIIYKHGRNEVCLPLESSRLVDNIYQVDKIYQLVTNIENIPRDNFYLTFNGKCLQQSDIVIASPCTVRFHLRLPGGKGGFGSMLRAIGARIEKTTNHEACRDLSGRRMRDVNYEKEMGEWLKKKEEAKEDNGEKQKQRIAKLEKIINPKHNYQDAGYTTNLQNNAEKIDEALKVALQKRDEKINLKRKVHTEKSDSGKQKKSRMWMGVDDEDSDEDGEDSDADGEDIVAVSEDQPSCSKESTADVDVQKQADCCADSIDVNGSCSSRIDNTELSTSVVEGENLIPPSTKTVEDVVSTDSSSACEISLVSSSATGNDEEKNDHKGTVPADISAGTLSNQGAVDSELRHRVVNLDDFESAEHLESVGLDAIKSSLMALGLKCGGTLEERAKRLFITKNVPLDQLDPSFFAKQSKGKNKKQKR